jgi:hypothetical protein
LLLRRVPALDQEILSGDAAICFLSPELFETMAKEGAFIPVSGYAVAVPEGGEVQNDHGRSPCKMNFGLSPLL